MLRWIEEHRCSYEFARHSRPQDAKREWRHLDDAVQQATRYCDLLAELLLDGQAIDPTNRRPAALEQHAIFSARRRSRWMWQQGQHPGVLEVLDEPLAPNWCDRLETAPQDAVVGKVLCTCVALELAREVVFSATTIDETAVAAVQLLAAWIDEPTERYFAEICALLFGDDAPILDEHGVVGSALRTATSSVGNYEAGWALAGACERAQQAGLAPERISELASRAITRRIARS